MYAVESNGHFPSRSVTQAILRMNTRSPTWVFIWSVVTLGVYLYFWYRRMYLDLEKISGHTPTGRGHLFDAFLTVLTLGIYGIYVDYQISQAIYTLQKEVGMPNPRNDAIAVIILDIAAYLTIFISFFISSALQQDQLNRLIEYARANPGALRV